VFIGRIIGGYRPLLAALVLLFPGYAVMVQASSAEPESDSAGIVPVIENGKRIYTVGQFIRFAPQTAADIVQQIPGFSITNVSNDRGLGEASQNVLINGQRITGKGNDAQSVLRRISVNAVRRLEIMDAAMLDISGLSGHVLNVLTEQGGVQGNFVWRPQIRERIPDHWTAGEVNVSGKVGFGDFALGLRMDGFRGGGWGGETELRPATGVSLWRAQKARFSNDIPKLLGSFNHKTESGSIWNINASVDRQHFRRHIATLYQRPGAPQTTEDNRGENTKWRTEIGTDYELELGAGRLKLIGFFTERDGPNVNELTSQLDGAAVPTGSRFSRDSTEGERVLRSEYRWKGLDADWTLSAEVAHNFVDVTGALAALDGSGVYQPVILPGASSLVQEQRGESVLSFSRSLGSDLSLQVSGGGEYSVLRQDGESGKKRSFWRPKGSVSLAWNPVSLWEMNLKLQRKVGQLNFFDFLASVDLQNNNANTSNPALVPPQSWLAQLEVIRSLGAHGKIKMSVEAEDISDIVDQVPISPTLEAPGNLPKAQRYKASLDASLLLDAVGIPGGKLDSLVTLRDTSVRDPVLGINRQLNGNRYYWKVDFRHDVPGTPWTWGLFSEYQSKDHFYRLDFEEVAYQSRPFGAIFLEHKDLLGLKVRATVANLYSSRDRSQQVAYVDRRDGPVDYTRDYSLTFHPFYRLQVSGTF
jgi:outer membrane receptor for ferrienterochelin and colicins